MSRVGGTDIQVRREIPWERRLRRLKRGIDIDAPLDAQERQEQEQWERFLDSAMFFCSDCRFKDDANQKDPIEGIIWVPPLDDKPGWDDWSKTDMDEIFPGSLNHSSPDASSIPS